MACILWMPAAQGMPNRASAIGRSFSLWFIFLSWNCNRMGNKRFKGGALPLTGWGNGTPLNSPLHTAVWLQMGKEDYCYMRLELRIRAGTEGKQTVQHSSNCLGDSVVVTWNWWTTGRLCSKSTQGGSTFAKPDEGTRAAPASSRSACS